MYICEKSDFEIKSLFLTKNDQIETHLQQLPQKKKPPLPDLINQTPSRSSPVVPNPPIN